MSRGADVGKPALWRRRMQEFDRGSSSVAEFCQRIGVSKATFYVWRQKLRASSPSLAAQGESATALSFLPVQITGASGTVEVVLTNGTRVLVPSSDREALRTVVQVAAEVRSC